MEVFSSILIALFIYVLGIASPGPSNLAIAHASIYAGRKAGVSFALGVTMGSFFWGICAASGLQPLLSQYSNLLYILKFSTLPPYRGTLSSKVWDSHIFFIINLRLYSEYLMLF